MLRYTLLFIAIIASAVLHAQEDSTRLVYPDSNATPVISTSENFFEKRLVQSTFVGVPLFAAGLIEMGENKHFRQLRTDFLPSFKSEWENRIQYMPGVVMLAMKVCGVESRSSWPKMITADAISTVLMAGVTNSIKYTAKERRPDGTSKNSFPSGHTATAFMTATMLEKEYGHISPWIAIGGYSMATATGVMRMVNNRHWMSDVLAGAGIGIVATEFGYWIADALFPKTKKSYDPKEIALTDTDAPPSFFGLYAGFYAPIKSHKLNEKIRSSTGGTTGFEGAYFWNRHWGVGGLTGFSDINYIANTEDEVVGSTHFWTTQTGLYFSYPLYERLFIGAKAISGPAFFPKQNEQLNITNQRRVGFCSTAGISLGLRTREHFDFKMGCDYGTIQSCNKDKNAFFHTIILTGSASIRF